MNLLPSSPTNGSGNSMPVTLRRPAARSTGLLLPVADMSKIIKLSIPIGTIAISSVAVFAFSWVGLALLGF